MNVSRVGKLAAGLMATALLATACGSSGGSGESSGSADATEPVKIGISQYVSHPSLDAVTEGFKKGMKDAGYTGDKISYDLQNAQADASTNTAIMNQFSQDNLDLVLAVATPAAQAAAQAITDAPVLFSAVTDPVEAKLVKSVEEPGGNVTGTSDKNPVKEQMELLKELAPDAKSVGIVYSSGEVNSTVQVKWAKEAAADLDLEIKEAAISASSEVQQAAESLKVDAYYVPTDNAVVSALEGLLQTAQSKKVPVIAADGESVKRGATATYGINYEKLGVQTADMAVKILKDGEKPADMPVETLTDVELYVNTAAAKKAGVEIPQDMIDKAAEVYKK
ncbi:MAG: ABC transporter substrate-binding protein [Arthrobacter sp.]|uniref:ABC transporter substrate-binding protein n=1 Tax=unclassified Arthrobacter TaxID=235627 RepID=UPI0026532E2A|nr:ABC transporter substrate-binding protein [Micrococcaceae bacterium]MDN5812083.1 ABC transporter substrate-binding protein [Micrococcaceae bacterium]MDN5823659.1 ABC transporter substrate-binding protein [Micrococcaceae bacterium]MDN5879832.1 ABC transporter substrate-binding protein [Micrococcaceae bacterium]MDN5887249.1 ABC transporter substrate-binding protein [Micrococcaceae bacterium]